MACPISLGGHNYLYKFSGKRLSGKRLVREMSVRESDCPSGKCPLPGRVGIAAPNRNNWSKGLSTFQCTTRRLIEV